MRFQAFLLSCKNSIENKGFAGAVFVDLSKGFHCANHGLLSANLSAYELNSDALQLIRSYLTNRIQRVKINRSYSTWVQIGVPQGPVLGALLYNIFINDIFCFPNHTKICNYADDTTVFTCHSDLGIVIRQLEDNCSVIVKWFSDLLKLSDEKCHLIVFGDKNTEITIKIGNAEVTESD